MNIIQFPFETNERGLDGIISTLEININDNWTLFQNMLNIRITKEEKNKFKTIHKYFESMLKKTHHTDEIVYFKFYNKVLTHKYRFNNKFGYTIITRSLINLLTKHLKFDDLLLEIGAGNGLLTLCLRLIGYQIVAIDDFSIFKGNKEIKIFTPVERLSNINSIKKYKPDILIFGWPIEDISSYHTLKNFKGNKIIYIGLTGKFYYKCGGLGFHQLLKNEWMIIDKVNLPSLHPASVVEAIYYIRKKSCYCKL